MPETQFHTFPFRSAMPQGPPSWFQRSGPVPVRVRISSSVPRPRFWPVERTPLSQVRLGSPPKEALPLGTVPLRTHQCMTAHHSALVSRCQPGPLAAQAARASSMVRVWAGSRPGRL